VVIAGVTVLGFYLLATAAGFQGALAALTRPAQALPSSDGGKASDAASGPLLLHIDAVTGKCAAKVLSGEANGAAAAPRPAELSFGPALSNFQALATQFRLDADVPIPKVQAAALAMTCLQLILWLSADFVCHCAERLQTCTWPRTRKPYLVMSSPLALICRVDLWAGEGRPRRRVRSPAAARDPAARSCRGGGRGARAAGVADGAGGVSQRVGRRGAAAPDPVLPAHRPQPHR